MSKSVFSEKYLLILSYIDLIKEINYKKFIYIGIL